MLVCKSQAENYSLSLIDSFEEIPKNSAPPSPHVLSHFLFVMCQGHSGHCEITKQRSYEFKLEFYDIFILYNVRWTFIYCQPICLWICLNSTVVLTLNLEVLQGKTNKKQQISPKPWLGFLGSIHIIIVNNHFKIKNTIHF